MITDRMEWAEHGWTRRQLLASGAISTGIAVTGAGFGSPVRAAASWGAGPKSGLPFWLGAHSTPDKVVALMPGRSLDVVNDFENARAFFDVASDTIAGWRTRAFDRYLIEGRASALQCASSPFCSGSGYQVPTTWPPSAAAITSATWAQCQLFTDLHRHGVRCRAARKTEAGLANRGERLANKNKARS